MLRSYFLATLPILPYMFPETITCVSSYYFVCVSARACVCVSVCVCACVRACVCTSVSVSVSVSVCVGAEKLYQRILATLPNHIGTYTLVA